MHAIFQKTQSGFEFSFYKKAYCHNISRTEERNEENQEMEKKLIIVILTF